jgi:hypothetical protein
MPEPIELILLTASFETTKYSMPKILASSLLRSLFSGSVHVFRNHEIPLISEISFLKEAQIMEKVETDWASLSLVHATLALLRTALADGDTTHFILVSESWFPVRPFDQLRMNLTLDDRSRMEIPGHANDSQPPQIIYDYNEIALHYCLFSNRIAGIGLYSIAIRSQKCSGVGRKLDFEENHGKQSHNHCKLRGYSVPRREESGSDGNSCQQQNA